jgi:hypothetical protein
VIPAGDDPEGNLPRPVDNGSGTWVRVVAE